jgi:hypothetical protein
MFILRINGQYKYKHLFNMLLNLKMPKMNDLVLSQKFKNKDPNPLFRFITAANKEYIEHLKKNNPDIEKSVITIRFG